MLSQTFILIAIFPICHVSVYLFLHISRVLRCNLHYIFMVQSDVLSFFPAKFGFILFHFMYCEKNSYLLLKIICLISVFVLPLNRFH